MSNSGFGSSSLGTRPTHTTQSHASRKRERELAEARASGAAAPAVDIKTGTIINPHNPEFLTRRPWYLGGDADAGPSLDHLAKNRGAAVGDLSGELSMSASDAALRRRREEERAARKEGKLQAGMWVECLKHGKKPYVIAKIVSVKKSRLKHRSNKRRRIVCVRFEDGIIEKDIKSDALGNNGVDAIIRMTKTGNRAVELEGKEGYDAKRDRYHGFEAEDYSKKIVPKFGERDSFRRKTRERKMEREMMGENDGKGGSGGKGERKDEEKASDSDSDADSDASGSDSDDEFVQRDGDAKMFTSRLARQGGVGGAQMKVTARNLRIREDTAKYLRNLDPDSAYYDPKSRSMRANPNPEIDPSELTYAGDNFARGSGDVVGLAETQLFAWEATNHGLQEIHPQANPSQAELLKRQFRDKSGQMKRDRQTAIFDRYGGREYLDAGGAASIGIDIFTVSNDARSVSTKTETEEERRARLGTSMRDDRYTRDGRLVRAGTGVGGEQKVIPVASKYEEDVTVNGHLCIWGSYFHKGAFRWGYDDDHSLLKNSYCTGPKGRVTNDEANELKYSKGSIKTLASTNAREM
uniref:Pre-mRNA-splicing factor SLU7 n=1 Tax=Corethron hystrix TaxID=216773 RepID=A0A7S1BTZ8_9STRA|mmetsp:Transcript_40975/g.96207  ORF Transcript_40975/g.96207 Transcript_40975/m.96207 type:complete len:580 (+) Transcript_40975:186-1925(+)